MLPGSGGGGSQRGREGGGADACHDKDGGNGARQACERARPAKEERGLHGQRRLLVLQVEAVGSRGQSLASAAAMRTAHQWRTPLVSACFRQRRRIRVQGCMRMWGLPLILSL